MADTEYAVIGAGIAGASVAYHLSERTDAPITVYERGTPGAETTRKSMAWVGLYGDPVEHRLKRYAFRCYNDFLESPAADPAYGYMGRLTVATTTAGADTLAAAASAPTDPAGDPTPAGIRDYAEYLPGDDIEAGVLAPPLATGELVGALFRPRVWHLTRPRAFALEFLERARANGVAVFPDTRVTGVRTADGAVTGLDTRSGPVDADRVVCAAGPWNSQVAARAGVDLPVRHTLAPVLQLAPPAPIESPLPTIEHEESPYGLHRRGPDRVLINHYPGGYADAGTEYDPDTMDETVPEGIRERGLAVAERLLPLLADATVTDEWVGIRSVTPDGNPIAGWTDVEGFAVAAFNSSGMQLAPGIGRLIARQLVDGQPTRFYDAVSISRFDGRTDVHGGAPPGDAGPAAQ